MYFHRSSVSNEEQGKEMFDHQPQHSSNLQKSSFSTSVENGKARCYCFIISGTPLLRKIRNAYALLWKHFIQAYTNYRVIKWSIWWALATCGYMQVINYIQLLWQTAVKSDDEIYNGAVDFIYAILGKEHFSCLASILFQICKIKIANQNNGINSELINYIYYLINYILDLAIVQSR